MIRVADRQGILVGRHLSAVQRFAIRTMLHLESRASTEEKFNALKRSLMAADPIELGPELFPDYFPPAELRALETMAPDAELQIVNSIKDSEVDEYLALMGVQRV